MLDQTMAIRGKRGYERRSYRPPERARSVPLTELLTATRRRQLEPKQLNLLRSPNDDRDHDVTLHYAGNLDLLSRPCVAIVGSRRASAEGVARASRLARELCESGVVVVSGLALGIDAAAHKSAIASGGATIGVVGTPLDKAYPAENAYLQEQIHVEHLLISPFDIGEKTFKSSFPKRNRVMAALSDATVIIEASDTSGSLHQAAECLRLGRWLFIARSLTVNPDLDWPKKFLERPKVLPLSATAELIAALREGKP